MMVGDEGGDIKSLPIIPYSGQNIRPYGRPVMFRGLGFIGGIILLMFFFGGIRHLIHYKIWKSAGMPYPKDRWEYWAKHPRGPWRRHHEGVRETPSDEEEHTEAGDSQEKAQ